VIDIHTCWHVATMEDLNAIWDSAVGQLPRHAMCAMRPSVDADLSVPKDVPVPGPQVAPGFRARLPLAIKSFVQWNPKRWHNQRIAQ
jgi:hypothetical protein